LRGITMGTKGNLPQFKPMSQSSPQPVEKDFSPRETFVGVLKPCVPFQPPPEAVKNLEFKRRIPYPKVFLVGFLPTGPFGGPLVVKCSSRF